MPPLHPISGKRMRKLLLLLGFEEIRIRGSHHFFYKKTTGQTATVPIHGNEVLPVGLLRAILRDIELSVDVFDTYREQI